MKKLLVFLMAVAFGATMWAQAPQGINYQAVARDASGAVYDGQNGTVTVSILDAVGGTVLYQEEHQVTTNQFGLFTLTIGQGTALQNTFSAINWSVGDKYLHIEADFGNGTEDMGTTQLLSVPYALYAETSGDGPPGKNSLVNTVPATNCPNGGYTIQVGVDTNGDSVLDTSEITGTFDVCNGQDGNATSLTAGNGINIDFLTNTISNTGDLDSLDDKINNIALNGNLLTIMEGVTPWVVDLSSLIKDTSNTNEIQVLSMSGNTITLSNGGGNINLSSTTPATGDVLYWNGSNWAAQALSDGDWTISGNDIYNGNTGNVGIGTTSPNYPLHLHTTTGTATLQLTNNITNSSSTDGLQIKINTFGEVELDNRENTAMSFLTNGSYRMTITNTGKVGIGTNTPTAILHIYNPTTTPVGLYMQSQGANKTAGMFHITSSSNGNNTYALDVLNEGNATYNYGVNVSVTGGSSYTSYGIYSSVTAGTNRWAGYFAAGNVYIADTLGIGTSSPTAKLDVLGTFRLRDGSQANGYVLTTDASGNASWTDPLTISDGDWIKGSNGVYNTTDNIGIGTTTPAYPLQINYSGIANNGLYVNYTSTASIGANSGIYSFAQATTNVNVFAGYFQAHNSSSASSTWSIYAFNTATAPINYGVQANVTGGTGALGTINYAIHAYALGAETNWAGYFAAGNVYIADTLGVGTTSPATKLHVTSNSSTIPEITIENTANGRSVTFNSNGEIDAGASSGQTLYLNRSVSGDVVLANGGGNVGIGTNAPNVHLEIFGNETSTTPAINGGSSSTTLRIHNDNLTNNNFSAISFSTKATNNGIYESAKIVAINRTHSWQSDLAFFTRQSSNLVERMRIDSIGRVGIGTTSPATKLHVNGSVTAASFIIASDKRYKNTITPLIQAMELILQINPVSYYFNKNMKNRNFDNRLHYGLIAQDLEKIIPNIVHTDKEGYKSVNYIEIIPVLIKGMQEQQQLIEQLQQELKQIKEQLK